MYDREALLALLEYDMPHVRFSIFRVDVVDVADQETYEALMAALADRGERFVGEMPVAQF